LKLSIAGFVAAFVAFGAAAQAPGTAAPATSPTPAPTPVTSRASRADGALECLVEPSMVVNMGSSVDGVL
jgi:hypothetical protein